MHPNSGADEATFLAGWRQAAFSQRPSHGHGARAGNLLGAFPRASSLPQPLHGRTASTIGGDPSGTPSPSLVLSFIDSDSVHPTEPRAQREETSLSSQRKEIKITRRWRYRGIWPRSQFHGSTIQLSNTFGVWPHILKFQDRAKIQPSQWQISARSLAACIRKKRRMSSHNNGSKNKKNTQQERE